MSVNSQKLRFIWFFEQLVRQAAISGAKSKPTLLDVSEITFAIPAPIGRGLEKFYTCRRIEKLAELMVQQDSAGYSAVLPGNRFHALVATTVLEKAGKVFSFASHVLTPGGVAACLLSPVKEKQVSLDDYLEALRPLAEQHCLTIVHASQHEAPLGADPVWYNSNDIFLVLKNTDTPAGSSPLLVWPQSTESFVPQTAQPWALPVQTTVPAVPASLPGRIRYLTGLYEAKSFLEINIYSSRTFDQIKLPAKVRVSDFDRQLPQISEGEGSLTLNLPSGQFFAEMKNSPAGDISQRVALLVPSRTFDILYINAGADWKTVLETFTQCLPLSHPNSLIILNALIPSDPYSALPDSKLARNYRQAAGLKKRYHYGDAYKALFYIHDFFPQYSYCTLPGIANQTFLWLSDAARTPFFPSREAIEQLSYFDMLKHASLLMPVEADLLPRLIGKKLSPALYARPSDWKKLVTRLEPDIEQ